MTTETTTAIPPLSENAISTDEQPLKFCKDCKFAEDDPKYPHCLHPDSKKGPAYDLVTAAIKSPYFFCTTQRVDQRACGHEAKWFEPKGVFADEASEKIAARVLNASPLKVK